MVKYIVALVLMCLGGQALAAPSCDDVFQMASAQQLKAGKKFRGGKRLPGGLMLIWSDGQTTDVLLLVEPGKTLNDSRLFKSSGTCATPDGSEVNVYVASTKNESA